MSVEAECAFRPYVAADIPFIHNSWGSSYYSGNTAHKATTPDEFQKYHRALRERFLNRPTASVIICTPKEDEWFILGWIAVEVIASAIIVEYVYTRELYKKGGIATALIKRVTDTNPVIFTHLTEKAAKIMASKYDDLKRWKHIPHLV